MRDTFVYVSRFIDHIKMIKMDQSLSIILVGAKKDLENERQVQTSEGKLLAEKMGVLFYETSAKTRCNVEEVFFELVRCINQSKKAILEEENHEKSKTKRRYCVIN